jgi:hypothetical protein
MQNETRPSSCAVTLSGEVTRMFGHSHPATSFAKTFRLANEMRPDTGLGYIAVNLHR